MFDNDMFGIIDRLIYISDVNINVIIFALIVM